LCSLPIFTACFQAASSASVPVKQKHRCAQHEGHAGGSGVAVGAAVRRVRGGIHLGSGSGRIGIVYVRHGSLRGRRLASN
ncbi:hypothetical protein, partial [Neisseria sp. 23W00734]|uniref:hypothetical protein n=1 Tax=Neisseria sp. 23W00734 TaxID=3374307 RepID=UPI0037580EB2